MCLFPKFITNKRYFANKKNGGTPPPLLDDRVGKVPVGCGVCIECMRKKAREWRVRLCEEIKDRKYKYFVTLTFSNESLETLSSTYKISNVNDIAKKATRLFLERWRRKYKKSLRHWLITELGHENTERIHLHGIFFSDNKLDTSDFEKIWAYGMVYVGDYCNVKTVNYIIKYVTKLDTDHKGYRPKILCSAGLGSGYTKRYIPKTIHQFKDTNTIEYYRFENGAKISLPIYYRNKFFTDEQREKLWLNLLDKAERYVLGVKISNVNTENGLEHYYRVLKKAQESNKLLGYGDDSSEWVKEIYHVTNKMINKI